MTAKQIKFKPKPGQIDYTNIKRAPVINCVVKFNDEILLVKRNSNMHFYPDYWNGISGFLDDNKNVEEKVIEELSEEASIGKGDIVSIKQGDIFEQAAPEYDKIWIVHPMLVEVDTKKIKLDQEAQNYKWLKPEAALRLELLPGFDMVLKTFF